MRALIARMQEKTGIYGLGWDPDSVRGIVLPVAFVIIVGGIGFVLVRAFN